MDRPLILDSDDTNFCIYGLGTTGQSVISFFKKKNFKKFQVWDDNKILRDLYGLNKQKKKRRKNFF